MDQCGPLLSSGLSSDNKAECPSVDLCGVMAGGAESKQRHADFCSSVREESEAARLPQEVLMTSRSSAYFHLLRSYFLTPAAAFVACTCAPLRPSMEQRMEGKESVRKQQHQTGLLDKQTVTESRGYGDM